MIVSVPHTGTRSLMRALGETQFWHFGQNERDFENRNGHVDFPIRDPLATSISWRCFQKDREDMDEFRRWELAFRFLERREHTIHKVEDLEHVEGNSGGYWAKEAYLDHDLDTLKVLPEVDYLLRWYPRHEAFFRPHYGEFWWQT